MSDVSEAETDVLCATCGGKGWYKVMTARGERVRACKNCDKGKEAQAAWDAMSAQERADTMLKLLGKYRPKKESSDEEYHGLQKCRIVRMYMKLGLPEWGAALATLATVVVVLGLAFKLVVAFFGWLF